LAQAGTTGAPILQQDSIVRGKRGDRPAPPRLDRLERLG
jgi:hypothetical protein